MPAFETGTQEIILRRIRDIPSLPEVVNRIIELLARPQTPASEIARLISYDPGLSARVLRMVNSAAYGFQRQISSIQHGIMILGFNTVRGLVLSASIFRLFEEGSAEEGLDHKAFWRHSMTTALAARVVASRLRLPELPDLEDAFSAGMLHDIGKIVMDVYFTADYRRVLAAARRQRTPFHGEAFLALEQLHMNTDHTAIGAYLAHKWKLPVTLAEAVEYHHAPERAEHCPTLVRVVALANELARLHAVNAGVFDPERLSPEGLEALGLSPEDAEALHRQVAEETETLEELLATLSRGR